VRRALSYLTLALVGLGWLLFLHPQTMGGRAAYVVVSGTSMEPTMSTGDLVIARKRDSYRVGDAVVFAVPEGETGAGKWIIHRIIGGSNDGGFVIQGDNRDTPDQWNPTADELVGKQLVHVPSVGRWLPVLSSPLVVGTSVAMMAMWAVATSGSKKSKPVPAAAAEAPVEEWPHDADVAERGDPGAGASRALVAAGGVPDDADGGPSWPVRAGGWTAPS